MDKLLALVFVFLLFLCHSLVRLTRFMLDQHHLYKALVNIPGPEFRLSFFGNLNLLLEIAKNSDNRADVSKGKCICLFAIDTSKMSPLSETRPEANAN